MATPRPQAVRFAKIRNVDDAALFWVIYCPFALKEHVKQVPHKEGRRFIPGEKLWLIPERYRLEGLFPAGTQFVRDPEIAQRAVEWIKAAGNPWNGNPSKNAPPPFDPTPRAAGAQEPWATLHLLPGAPFEVARAAYRALALLHHPDNGGQLDRMKALNLAWEKLEPLLRPGRAN